MFKKGQTVIKILQTGSLESATIKKIASATKTFVQCDGDEHLKYHPNTGREIDPAPGFAAFSISSRIIPLDGE